MSLVGHAAAGLLLCAVAVGGCSTSASASAGTVECSNRSTGLGQEPREGPRAGLVESRSKSLRLQAGPWRVAVEEEEAKKEAAHRRLEEISGTLVAYWDFDVQGAAAEIEDVTGSGHTLTSATIPQAEVLDGEGLRHTSALSLPDGTSASATVEAFRTASLWVKRAAGCCESAAIFNAWYNGAAHLQVVVQLDTAIFTVNFDAAGSSKQIVLPITTEVTWVHLAVTLGQDEISAYVGSQSASTTGHAASLASLEAGAPTLTVQLGTEDMGGQLQGFLDDVRLYAEALPAEAVEALRQGEGAFAGAAQAPMVYGGAAQRLRMPVTVATLDGLCDDLDGPMPASATWVVISQPEAAQATVDDPSNVTSTVTFSGGQASVGDYQISLSCSDGNATRTSTVVLSVEFVAPTSLSAYWRFEELHGMRTVTDDSGFGSTLTLTRYSRQYPWVDMQVGAGLAGSTGAVFITRSAARAVVKHFRTLSLWLRVDAGCCERISRIVSATRKSSGVDYFRFNVKSGRLRAMLLDIAGTQAVAYVDFDISNSSDWVHFAVSIGSEEMLVYRNGEEVGSVDTASQLGDVGEEDLDFTVGTGGPHHLFLGAMDEIRLYQTALQGWEVSGLAAAAGSGGLLDGEVAPLRVDAGPAQSIWPPAPGGSPRTVQLAGSCTGGTGSATNTWTLASLPDGVQEADVTIENPTSLATAVTLASSPGDYVLALTCDDGQQSRTSQVTLVLFEPHEELPGAVVRNEGQPAELPGVAGAAATPVGLWLFDGDMSDSGSGRQTAQIVQLKGNVASYEFVSDGKFGGALNVSCTDSACVQLDLGSVEPVQEPWRAMSVSFWFNSPKHKKLALFSKGSFIAPCCGGSGAEETNQWHHYVMAHDSATKLFKLYLDSKIIQMETREMNRTAEDAAETMMLGLRTLTGTHTARGFHGLVDELAVFDYMLSNEEIDILRFQGAAGLGTERPPGNPYNRGDYAQRVINEYFQPPPLEENYEGFFQGQAARQASPEPYVHPRIAFTPEELPKLRERLRTTTAGRIAMETMRSLLLDSFPYDILSERNLTLEEVRRPGVYFDKYPQMMVFQAFRCLIDGDREMAARLGQQLDSLADEIIPYVEAFPGFAGTGGRTDWFRSGTRFDETDTWKDYMHDALIRNAVALMYDFLYPYLDAGTREKTRRAIALATQNTWSIGMDAIPAYWALTSNWIPLVTFDLALNLLAIEGEDGFDEGVYERILDVFHGWTTLGVSATSGASFEGGGKNSLGGTVLMAMAWHGHSEFIAAQGPRKFGTEFLLHCMLPNGKFFEDDKWGSVESRPQFGDIGPLKFAFPEDKVLDYIYRLSVRAVEDKYHLQPRDYQRLAVEDSRVFTYNSDMLSFIYTSDWQGPEDILEHEAVATAGQPLTYVAEDMGLLITRSAWADREAAWFALNVRSLPGGHAAEARGEFLFHALGETWAFYPFNGDSAASRQHSVVLVDGEGQSTSPGRFLGFVDEPEATWASCDLRYPYSNANWHKESVNYFMAETGDHKWMDLPWGELSHWYRGVQKLVPDDGLSGALEDFTMAFRTGGLVRSATSPYALIFDDFQKDNESHSYVWQMALKPTSNGVAIDRSHIVAMGSDLILDGMEGASLLVRLLDGSSTAALAVDQSDASDPRVTITAQAIAVRFRVLLWPFRQGAELPATTWDEGNGLLSIEDPSTNSSDVLRVSVHPDGMSTAALATSTKTVATTEGPPGATATASPGTSAAAPTSTAASPGTSAAAPTSTAHPFSCFENPADCLQVSSGTRTAARWWCSLCIFSWLFALGQPRRQLFPL